MRRSVAERLPGLTALARNSMIKATSAAVEQSNPAIFLRLVPLLEYPI